MYSFNIDLCIFEKTFPIMNSDFTSPSQALCYRGFFAYLSLYFLLNQICILIVSFLRNKLLLLTKFVYIF